MHEYFFLNYVDKFPLIYCSIFKYSQTPELETANLSQFYLGLNSFQFPVDFLFRKSSSTVTKNIESILDIVTILTNEKH